MSEPRNIVLVLMTPLGPTILHLTVEELTSFAETLNSILDSIKGKTPIPEVFEDAFKKEE